LIDPTPEGVEQFSPGRTTATCAAFAHVAVVKPWVALDSDRAPLGAAQVFLCLFHC